MKHTISLSILLMLLLLAMPFDGRCTDHQLFVTSVMPLSQSLQGHYGGIVKDRLTTWGGFYRDVNFYTGQEQLHYDPVAYGASVNVPEGFLAIGGMHADGTSSACMLFKDVPHRTNKLAWRYDASGRERRPAMPVGIYRHAAVLGNGHVYVAGGLCDSVYNNKVYKLEWPKGTEWTVECEVPGAPRVSPQLLALPDGLLLLGGSAPSADTLDYTTWQKTGVRYSLSRGDWKERSWTDVPDTLFPAAGGVSMPMGAYCTLFVGGRERSGDYRRHMVIYNRLTNRWSRADGDPSFARTDAVLTPYRDGGLLSGGQTAQGENTSEVVFLQYLPTPSAVWTMWVFGALVVLLSLVLTPLQVRLRLAGRRVSAVLSFFLLMLFSAGHFWLVLHYFAAHPEAFPFNASSLWTVAVALPATMQPTWWLGTTLAIPCAMVVSALLACALQLVKRGE